jgi:hypothetical protein
MESDMPYINLADLNKIQDALMSRDELACVAAQYIVTAARDNCADPGLVQSARDEYQTDDVEIDDEGVPTSEGENGTWVGAWVWIADPEPDDETIESDDEVTA